MTLKDICTVSGISLRELQGGNACIRLSGDTIDRLPENLDLTHLYVFGSNLEAIPECSYAIELVLIDCPKLRKLPDSCRSFERDLCLEGCISLTELPAIKKVGGNLDISRTSIRNLPEGIRIGKSLYAYESKLVALPENIQVGEDVIMDDYRN